MVEFTVSLVAVVAILSLFVGIGGSVGYRAGFRAGTLAAPPGPPGPLREANAVTPSVYTEDADPRHRQPFAGFASHQLARGQAAGW